MGNGITDVERGLCDAPTGLASGDAWLQTTERMRRIVKIEGHLWIRQWVANDAREPGFTPRQMLAGTRRFDNEEERLLYLRFMLEAELEGTGARSFDSYYGPRDPERIAAAMAQYELDRLKSLAARAAPPVPPPDTRGVASDWGRAAAQQAQGEYETYLLEVARIKDEEGRPWRGGGVLSGAATVDPYTYFIGNPVQDVAKRAIERVPAVVSLVLDFVPIIGQLKAVVEAMAGRDLITGRQLADWERGLNVLLALIPEARGIFKAGSNGMKVLANVAVQSRRASDEVYRVTKTASRLSEAEVRAAKEFSIMGKPRHPAAFEKVAGSLDEMTGTVSGRSYRVAAGVIEDGRGLTRSVGSSGIDTARAAPGKVVTPTVTSAKVAKRLSDAGIVPDAVATLERAGVNVGKIAKTLASPRVVAFVNRYHQCTGFELVVKDLAGGTKRKGAMFLIEFMTDAAHNFDPRVVKFELPAGITKTPTRETAARFTDLVVTEGGRTLNYEFKAYSPAAVNLALGNPKKLIQLVKDVVMFGRGNIRWVFDSRQVSRSYVYSVFRQAIRSDDVLRTQYGAVTNQALDELIVMYPPVR
ncbi:MAG TPA: pre-toxin TG domain-containing protein [Thermoanaerobaculia bacterium]